MIFPEGFLNDSILVSTIYVDQVHLLNKNIHEVETALELITEISSEISLTINPVYSNATEIYFFHEIDFKTLNEIFLDLEKVYKMDYPYSTREDFASFYLGGIKSIGIVYFSLWEFENPTFSGYTIGDYLVYQKYRKHDQDVVFYLVPNSKNLQYYNQYSRQLWNFINAFSEGNVESDSTSPELTNIKLTLSEIALLYVYNKEQIFAQNSQKIAQKFNHSSGSKLEQHYSTFRKSNERTGFEPFEKRKIKFQIKRIEKILDLIKNSEGVEMAHSDLSILNDKLQEK